MWASDGLGRFISRDPADADASESSYVYAGDNPTTYGDPTGAYKTTVLMHGMGVSLEQAPSYYMPFEKAVKREIVGSYRGRPEEFHEYDTRVPSWPRLVKDFGRRSTWEWWKADASGLRNGCRTLHGKRPWQACNVVGHSYGGLDAAFAANSGAAIDYLHTMASPTVGLVYGGTWFRNGAPRPRFDWWENFREYGKTPTEGWGPILRRLGEKTLGAIEGAPESNSEWRVNANHGEFWGANKQPPLGIVTEEAAFNICYERWVHQPSNKSGSCG
ncbi:MAG: hypothetical protein WDA27_10750 [Actinomycetota bacterium]